MNHIDDASSAASASAADGGGDGNGISGDSGGPYGDYRDDYAATTIDGGVGGEGGESGGEGGNLLLGGGAGRSTTSAALTSDVNRHLARFGFTAAAAAVRHGNRQVMANTLLGG